MRRLLIWLLLAGLAAPAKAQERVVRNEGDLPPTRFPMDAPASAAFLGEFFLRTTAPALKREAERVLAGSRIENEVIDQRLRSGLAAIAILERRPADAERALTEARARMSKPQHKAIGHLANEAIAAGLQASADRRCQATAERISTRLQGANPLVVRDEVLLRLSQSETASVGHFALRRHQPSLRPVSLCRWRWTKASST